MQQKKQRRTRKKQRADAMRQPVEVHERRAWPCSVVQRRASSTSQRARRQGKPDSRQGLDLMPTASLPLLLLLLFAPCSCSRIALRYDVYHSSCC